MLPLVRVSVLCGLVINVHVSVWLQDTVLVSVFLCL